MCEINKKGQGREGGRGGEREREGFIDKEFECVYSVCVCVRVSSGCLKALVYIIH